MPSTEAAQQGRAIVSGMVDEWTAARRQLRALEEAEHPDIIDPHGRAWKWKIGDLYTHDGMAFPSGLIQGLTLPSAEALTNPNYDWCAICQAAEPVEIDLDGLGGAVSAALAEPQHVTRIGERDSVGHYCWDCDACGEDGSGYETADEVTAAAAAHGPLAADSPVPVDEPEEEPEQPKVRIGRRVSAKLAKKHFDAGGDVVVVAGARARDTTCVVSRDTVVHNIGRTTWKELADTVKSYGDRSQRYYIAPTPGTPDVTEPEPAAEEERPKFDIPRPEAHPSIMEAITEVVENVLGTGKAGKEKRDKLITDLGSQLAALPIYGIEVDGARIGMDFIDLDNASIEVDGFGRASHIVAYGTPIWDAE
jgi:hypothetical protein